MKMTDSKLTAAAKRPAQAIDLAAIDALAQQAAEVETRAWAMPCSSHKSKERETDPPRI